LIVLLKEYNVEAQFANPDARHLDSDDENLFSNTRLGSWAICWLQYAHLKVEMERKNEN
jgi:hypothetical protein